MNRKSFFNELREKFDNKKVKEIVGYFGEAEKGSLENYCKLNKFLSANKYEGHIDSESITSFIKSITKSEYQGTEKNEADSSEKETDLLYQLIEDMRHTKKVEMLKDISYIISFLSEYEELNTPQRQNELRDKFWYFQDLNRANAKSKAYILKCYLSVIKINHPSIYIFTPSNILTLANSDIIIGELKYNNCFKELKITKTMKEDKVLRYLKYFTLNKNTEVIEFSNIKTVRLFLSKFIDLLQQRDHPIGLRIIKTDIDDSMIKKFGETLFLNCKIKSFEFIDNYKVKPDGYLSLILDASHSNMLEKFSIKLSNDYEDEKYCSLELAEFLDSHFTLKEIQLSLLGEYSTNCFTKQIKSPDSSLEKITVYASERSKLASSFLEEIISSLNFETKLWYLDISNTLVSMDEFIKIVPLLIKKNSLKTLNLSSNCFDKRVCSFIAVSLYQNSTLEELILDDNCVSNEGFWSLCTSLINNKTLRKLSLQNNAINAGALKYLCEVLTKNQTIEYIDLSRNCLYLTSKNEINLKGIKCLSEIAEKICLSELIMEDCFSSSELINEEHMKGFLTYVFRILCYSNDLVNFVLTNIGLGCKTFSSLDEMLQNNPDLKVYELLLEKDNNQLMLVSMKEYSEYDINLCNIIHFDGRFVFCRLLLKDLSYIEDILDSVKFYYLRFKSLICFGVLVSKFSRRNII